MKTLRSDVMLIWLVATTALCVGLLINQFRDTPLPLVYRDKAERLQDSVQRIVSKESASAPAPIVQLRPSPQRFFFKLMIFRAVHSFNVFQLIQYDTLFIVSIV